MHYIEAANPNPVTKPSKPNPTKTESTTVSTAKLPQIKTEKSLHSESQHQALESTMIGDLARRSLHSGSQHQALESLTFGGLARSQVSQTKHTCRRSVRFIRAQLINV